MNRTVTFALSSFLLLAHATYATHAASTLPADSVGVERKDGKRFVLHRVNQGQTLFAVARRYGSSIDAIRAANPDLTNNSLRYDQLLRVPLVDASLSRREQRDAEKALKKEEKEKEKVAKEAEPVPDVKVDVTAKTEPKPEKAAEKPKPEKAAEKSSRTANASSAGVHVVENGQTIYSLAVRYHVTMADLRRWNNLGAEGIQTGQSLIVSEKAYEAKKPADSSPVSLSMDSPSVASSKPASVKSSPTKSSSAKPKETAPVKLEAKPIVTPPPLPTPGTKPKQSESSTADDKPEAKAAEPKATTPRSDNEPVTTTNKANVKSEVGFADLIVGNDASTKYLALHRSAPVGTLVQVRNDITNQSLYVKVIGKLPDTGINNQVLIRLSSRAFEKLSPNGQRFRAEVSYSK